MSSPASEKQAKGKSKKATATKTGKSAKGGKEGTANDNKFRGEGTNFKCKLLGVAEVDGPRGDSMCVEAIKKLKQHIKQTGEHKAKIILNVTLMGIRILQDKTKNVLFEHPVNKVSFITHDPDDKKIFSFISSARCSSGHVGHMMYAIKYDKVAGVITSTLYELFQTVFKLRQEAAQKQRKAQPKPQTPDNISQASTATVSNGPVQASGINDNNIYEEPLTSTLTSTLTLTSTVSTVVSSNSDTSHYQMPAPRPLPPAPYSQSSSQESPLAVNQESKANSGDKAPDQAMNSSVSDQLFGASVFTQPDPSASDNVSVSSVDLVRKESISSSISSSSETASYDAKSLDIKSVTASSTPPSVLRTRPVRSISSAGQGLDAVKPTVPEDEDEDEDEDHDYETIPSSDYETIPSNLVVKNTASKTETKPGFAGFHFKESFKEDDESFPVSFASSSSSEKTKVDPFASSEKPEPKSTLSEESPPSSAVFSNDDFFSSHFDDKSKSAHAPTTDFPVDDPFAPTLNTASEESKTNEPFASSDAFESAFGSGKMSPVSFEQEQDNGVKFEGDINSNKTVKKDTQENEAFSSSTGFDAAFGTTESSPTVVKPTDNNVGENHDSGKPSSEEPIAELSWSNAFGENNAEENKDVTTKSEPSWSAAFEEDGKSSKEEHKTDESTVTFPWDDSFGTKFHSEESDKGQQPDNVSTEPDLSWTNAFSDKPKQEVNFSWDDAFGGQTDTMEGQTDTKERQTENDFGGISFNDAFGGQTDTKDGQTNVDFGGNSFTDAFGGQTNLFNSSTPFKSTVTKNENTVKGFIPSNFGAISTPIKADTSENEGKDKPDVSHDGKYSQGDETSKERVDSKEGSSERMATLAKDEDLSSSDKEKDIEFKSSEEKVDVSRTIPQIIEPTERDDSDDSDDDRPVTLPILSESPSVPPPLPPRPMAPLPSLPPRPRTYSSPVTGEIPPTPPRPVGSIASPASRTGMPKRLPPALPPRVDLDVGKVRANSTSVVSTSRAASGPFSSSKSTSENDNLWQVNWTSATKKEDKKDSKNSPDPFGDEFFTDFNFSESKTATVKTNSTATRDKNNSSFSDPFVSKKGEDGMFKADFGGVDPFADFSSNNTNIDDPFGGFSTNKDPFGDCEDPFADKGTLNDPFALSPKKDDSDGTSFQLSKNSSDGDFADSFA